MFGAHIFLVIPVPLSIHLMSLLPFVRKCGANTWNDLGLKIDKKGEPGF